MDIITVVQIKIFIFLVIAFLNFLLALVIWHRGKTKATLHLGITTFLSSLFILMYAGESFAWLYFPKLGIYFARLTWIAVMAPAAFIIFLYYFTERLEHLKAKIFIWYSTGGAIVALSLFTSLFAKRIGESSEDFFGMGLPTEVVPGLLEPIGRIYVLISLIVIFYNLLSYYFKAEGLKKLQIKYFVLGATIYTIVSVVTVGLIPLLFKTMAFVEVPSLFSFLWVMLTFYAIFKKNLFGIKVIVTELLVVAIGFLLVSLPFIMETMPMKIMTAGIFIAFSFIGYLLIKYTIKEEKEKEILEGKVIQQTQEIRAKVDELEKFYSLSVGRELKMAELKEKIKEMEKSQRIN